MLAHLALHRSFRGEVTYVVCDGLQILHYSTDCMEERLEFLQRIGMSSEEVVLAVARLPQLLCLDIEANLQPKYRYLLNELGGSVKSICTFPAYFSLSLYQR